MIVSNAAFTFREEVKKFTDQGYKIVDVLFTGKRVVIHLIDEKGEMS